MSTVEELHARFIGVMKQADSLGFEGRAEILSSAVDTAFDLDFMATFPAPENTYTPLPPSCFPLVSVGPRLVGRPNPALYLDGTTLAPGRPIRSVR